MARKRHRPRRLAFLAYYFPPLGGGGTARSAAYAKLLPEHGYHPTVFTVAPGDAGTGLEFQADASLDETFELGGVERVAVADPQPTEWRLRLERWRLFGLYRALLYPHWWELYRFWAMAAAERIVVEHRQRPFDLIYASAGPNSSLEAAAWAAAKLGIPWVADLRDLWTRDSLKFFPSRWHFRWEAHLERRLLGSAAAIIANTPLSATRLRDWLPNEVAARVTVIPNGFDETAERLERRERPSRVVNDEIVLVHTGTLYPPRIAKTRSGRYRPAALDHSARSILPLLRGMQALEQAEPGLARRLRVRLLGYAPPGTEALIADYGCAGRVHVEGVRPKQEALTAMREADALLVLQVAFADSDRPMPYVPGKLYDYLACRAPILAPVGPGDLERLLRHAPQAYVCDYRAPEGIATALSRLAADLDQGRVISMNDADLEPFRRRRQAGELAALFDSLMPVGYD